MPPKPKYTKEEIVQAAFEMARENGLESVVARELGKRLGISSTPIFTYFHSMNELYLEIRKRAMKEFETYTCHIRDYSPPFKQYGLQMIHFAKIEPHLFRILYMQEYEHGQNYDEMFLKLGSGAKHCVEILQEDYGLKEDQAYVVFKQVWLYTFSICVLIVNNICLFTDDEISKMLSMQFQSTAMMVQTGKSIDIEVSKKNNE